MLCVACGDTASSLRTHVAPSSLLGCSGRRREQVNRYGSQRVAEDVEDVLAAHRERVGAHRVATDQSRDQWRVREV